MGFCSCRESKIHTRERHFAGATYNEQDAADYRRERDGRGVACVHVLLGELADRIGLTAALSEATDGLRQRRTGRDPGRVLVDVAVAIADGATTISDVQALADQHGLHGCLIRS